jgi:hypothetical protein
MTPSQERHWPDPWRDPILHAGSRLVRGKPVVLGAYRNMNNALNDSERPLKNIT